MDVLHSVPSNYILYGYTDDNDNRLCYNTRCKYLVPRHRLDAISSLHKSLVGTCLMWTRWYIQNVVPSPKISRSRYHDVVPNFVMRTRQHFWYRDVDRKDGRMSQPLTFKIDDGVIHR